ncbi:MAG TPA: DUF2288 domain-containing protein [Geobacteraceae bacterium]|jgi:hypothetical protein|nr:DUF2288 domain-containing protein [Geobacteraceae bacterium]
MVPTREELALAVDEAAWDWLRAHMERGGLIVVAPDLDIAEVGVRLAADDAAAVGGWIAAGRLSKPSEEQIGAWDRDREKRFLCLIVSPYVLIQEKPAILQ